MTENRINLKSVCFSMRRAHRRKEWCWIINFYRQSGRPSTSSVPQEAEERPLVKLIPELYICRTATRCLMDTVSRRVRDIPSEYKRNVGMVLQSFYSRNDCTKTCSGAVMTTDHKGEEDRYGSRKVLRRMGSRHILFTGGGMDVER